MKDSYIVSKGFCGRFTESLFIEPMNLLKFLIFWSRWVPIKVEMCLELFLNASNDYIW